MFTTVGFVTWRAGRGFALAAIAAALSGCGAAGSASIPAPTQRAVASIGNSPRPADAVVAPAGTLYAAAVDHVYAFALDAPSGTAVAQRTIFPHPNQQHDISGLATSADGLLYVLDNKVEQQGTAPLTCRVVVERASADGSPPALATHLCDTVGSTAGQAIARNASGGYDVLYTDWGGSGGAVKRFGDTGNDVLSTLPFAQGAMSLGTDRSGHDVVAGNLGQISAYTSAATQEQDTLVVGAINGVPAVRPVAVSPGTDHTVYVVGGDALVEPQNIYALGPDLQVKRTIGPFTNHAISALAIDSHGNLYAAMWANGRGTPSKIHVYGPTASGTSAPDRIIVPSPASAYFTALAIAEQ